MLKIRNALFIILFLFVYGCTRTSGPFLVEGSTILLDSVSYPGQDSAWAAEILQYRASLEADMNRVLVYSEQVLERGTPEGLLNNFVADLIFEKGKLIYNPADGQGIDFCLLNYGGLRVPLPQGEITYARVFELLPFENEMVVVTLSPQKVQALAQYLASAKNGMPVSGIQLIIDQDQPQYFAIQGKDLDFQRNYKVLTSDYLAQGGDNMSFFLDPLHSEQLGVRVRDAIIAHMEALHEKGVKINAKLDGRIAYK